MIGNAKPPGNIFATIADIANIIWAMVLSWDGFYEVVSAASRGRHTHTNPLCGPRGAEVTLWCEIST